MHTVMVTGGIGSGKSTLVGMLVDHGALSLDLDEVNRTLLRDNDDYIADLVGRFGEGILDAAGQIVTSKLAACAFADAHSERDLNAIAHPYITERAQEYIFDVHCTPRTDARVLVVEVPLLTEAPDFATLADEVIAVAAPPEVRAARAVARGMEPDDVMARMRLQATDAERAALADTVCDNTGSADDLRAWADAWWKDTCARLDVK